MVKYNANQEIINAYENLQIVQCQFFTDMLIFIYIWSYSNIYWFIDIRIRCQQIQTNSYSNTFDYSYYSVSYLMSNNKGNFKLFIVTYISLYLAIVASLLKCPGYHSWSGKWCEHRSNRATNHLTNSKIWPTEIQPF